jgi:hypothetical protein
MATYNITIDSLEARPKIVVTFEEIPEKALKDAIYVATRTFRSVEVVNNETGEVVLTHYEGLQLHKGTFSYGEGIDIIRHYAYGDN